MRTQNLMAAALMCVLTLATVVARAADAFPSWNDGAAKQSIVNFVKRVATKGGKDFVPPAERIAVFDNDGTLWPSSRSISSLLSPSTA